MLANLLHKVIDNKEQNWRAHDWLYSLTLITKNENTEKQKLSFIDVFHSVKISARAENSAWFYNWACAILTFEKTALKKMGEKKKLRIFLADSREKRSSTDQI